MKVLYILHSSVMGGATISFINMISGLKELGIDIYIAIPKKDLSFIKRTEGITAGIFIVPIASSVLSVVEGTMINKSLLILKNAARAILLQIKKKQSLCSLSEIVNRINPDIIHTNTGIVHEGFFCAQSMGIPHVWHLREYQDLDFHFKILPTKDVFKSYLRESYVISITKGILSEFGLKNTSQHRVIYNGILPQKVYKAVVPKEKCFICASRVSPEKGHDDVIEVFSEFYKNHSDYRLVIMGFGEKSYINYLKQLSKRLHCDHAIEFIGYIEDVKPYLSRGAALIVASYNEGFGRMTAESCFLGTLVIGRDTGGTAEILNETGGLKFHSNEELLEMMIKVADMGVDEYKLLADDAQDKATNLYAIEKNVISVYQFYNDILSDYSNRRTL